MKYLELHRSHETDKILHYVVIAWDFTESVKSNKFSRKFRGSRMSRFE